MLVALAQEPECGRRPEIAERGGLQLAAVTAAFGRPAHTYHVAGYTILVWPENLLTRLG